ncbi:hypothetical protein NA78x_002778 [Anatilimnocola sp. NA78]|uniref:hypothetical protein n=1 Tax=Anatilimnocola sp. NA78 TaxID=3415683 RepID=UPI003CE4E466
MSSTPLPIAEDMLEWFLRGFTARDLTEPLLSVDETSPIAAAQSVISTSGAHVVGVRRHGLIAGWFSEEELATVNERRCCHPFAEATVVSENSPLSDVVCLLHAQPRLFVRAFGQISGVIPRAAIEKPPLRMWLFGLITISEQRVTGLIDEFFPSDSWQEQLSSGRLAKARELQALRRARGQRPTLLDCLQFADKGQIVARNESLRIRTRFDSRREVERFVQALQDLRNNLAHAQDIAGNWDIINELANNVHRIVCGADSGLTNDRSPEATSELPP